MLQQNCILAGDYLRLSEEDREKFRKDDSNSIESQRMMLQDYAKQHGIQIVDEYVDDGISGTSFERKDFMRMMADLEAGRINCVLVKDLSRLGRNYLESGRYQEIVFPEMGVRLIAPEDGYDSATGAGTELAPFKNLFNEWHVKEASQKTRAALHARASRGLYVATAPFGYKKDPNDRNALIVDEETAPTVQRIFSLSAGGFGFHKIARILTDEKLPSPAAIRDWEKKKGSQFGPTVWDFSTIREMIRNPVYMGNTVFGRTRRISYKVHKSVKQDPKDWIVVEGTHEPLVSRELWELAQSRPKGHSKPTGTGEPHLFVGLIKCADCGATMAKNGGKKNTFGCQAYKVAGQCSPHRVSLEHLSETVLAAIQEIIVEVQKDKDAFIERLAGIDQKQRRQKQAADVKDKARSEKRLAEIPSLIKKAFEQNAAGKLPDDLYSEMLDTYKGEREELTERIEMLSARIEQLQTESSKAANFVSVVEQYMDIQELDRDIVHALIDRIEVHQSYKENGINYQPIEILWRFVGQIQTLPI